MVVSILTRKTRITDRSQYEGLVSTLTEKLSGLFEALPGFVSVQYLWGLSGEGEIAQITTWATADDCRRYVREGVAATVATIEDGIIPTAAHPNGAWVRRTYEAVGS
jgi:heme-degrading monooxygenase HmoA